MTLTIVVNRAGSVLCATPSRLGDHGADWTVTISSPHGTAVCSWCDTHIPDRYRSEVPS